MGIRPDPPSELPPDRLRVLVEVSRTLPAMRDWTELVERMMDLVLATLGAERGVLFLCDADGHPRPEVVRGADDGALSGALDTSQRILAHALDGDAVLSDDAQQDERFATPSVIAHHIVSFMCVPLRRNDRVLGTLYVDHRTLARLFTRADLAFLGALADVCAVAIENSLLHRELEREVRTLRHAVDGKYRFERLLGTSPAMVALFRTMERVADSDATVLITGENGTGKELVARALHQHSARRERAFVTVDCGSLSPELAASELFGHRRGAFTGASQDRTGLFEQANGGTVFLDQVEDLPLGLQPHLLRVVQEGELRRVGETSYRKVRWRLIAATRVDLAGQVRAGRFREDLYYRLRGVPLAVPPLRDRGDDVPLLAQHFLDETRRTRPQAPSRFDRAALARLISHRWPGNVRELQHAVERAALMAAGDRIGAEDLGLDDSIALHTVAAAPPARARRAVSRDELVDRLRAHGGNVTLAADSLGMTRRGVQKMLKRLGLSREALSGEGA